MENPEKPVIVQKGSMKLVMEPGTYWWCACGRSKNQPFCDGSHKGTAFTPEKVVIENTELVAWCLCKHSKKGHICDNAHRELP
jgi:CDGSH-type Zn-finger protein